MPGLTLPPFPDNVPAHPLLVIDFSLIKAGDEKEIDDWEPVHKEEQHMKGDLITAAQFRYFVS